LIGKIKIPDNDLVQICWDGQLPREGRLHPKTPKCPVIPGWNNPDGNFRGIANEATTESENEEVFSKKRSST